MQCLALALFEALLFGSGIAVTLNISPRNMTFHGKVEQHFEFKVGPSDRKAQTSDCVSCELTDRVQVKLVEFFNNSLAEGVSMLSYHRGIVLGSANDHFQYYRIEPSSLTNHVLESVDSIDPNTTAFRNSSNRFVFDVPNAANVLLFFEGGRIVAYKRTLVEKQIAVNLLFESTLKLNTTRIRKVIFQNNILGILYGKGELVLAYLFPTGEVKLIKRFNHSSVAWEHKQTQRNSFRIVDVVFLPKSLDSKAKKHARPVKHCCKPTQFEELRCLEFDNFEIEITMIEPSYSKDKSILRISAKLFLSKDKLKRTKLKLALNFGTHATIPVWTFPAYLIRRKGNHLMKFGSRTFHFAGVKPKVLFSGEIGNFYLIVVKSLETVHMFQFFRLSMTPDIASIVIKHHTFVLPSEMNAASDSVAFVPYLDRTDFNLLVGQARNVGWYRLHFGHYRGVCRSTQRWFWNSCSQRLKLTFINWKTYTQSRGFENTGNSIDSTDLFVNYKFANINWESLLIIPIFAAIGIMMYKLMKPNAERKAKARAERIRKYR